METEAIQKLYNMNVELEGLLRVLEQRDSQHARQLLAEKFEAYSAAMHSLLGGDTADATLDRLIDDTKQVLKHEDHAPAETREVATIPPATRTVATADQPVQRTVATDPVPQRTVTTGPVQRTVATDPVMGRTVTSRVVSSIKVDEMVARNESADLRKAFTLNDKFRFRRELFHGSDEAFNRTLDLLESMQDYEQAFTYLTGDMQLDENNEAVAEFLTIIKRHFRS